MALSSLSARLPALPRVLAGPIVRRAEPTRVTVWVALRQPQKVTLRVYEREEGQRGAGQVMIGTRATVAVGANLHVAAVTATPGAADLGWGKLYRYNLFFGPHAADATPVPEDDGLFAPGVVHADPVRAREDLCYTTIAGAPRLPSFVLPPIELSQLRLLHGSCRKPHGGGVDALATADQIIGAAFADPAQQRPQQLFLTGDQIYADDVADALLAVLTDAGNTLLGWPETLPDVGALPAPGTRQRIATEVAGLSADPAKSHLLGLGEFCAMFLCAWSPVLWPGELPTFGDLRPTENATWDADVDRIRRGQSSSVPRHSALKSVFEDEVAELRAFRAALPKVRRALANVSTYMSFDDHEVTDDWYINAGWCDRVLGKPLGRRMLQNALAAYAVFEAWGNTPERFDSGAGASLLTSLEKWQGSKGADATADTAIATAVGVPDRAAVLRDRRLTHAAGALDWHYAFRGSRYEVLVLDTRTFRSFASGPDDPPALILEGEAWDRQLGGPAPPEAEITFVVSGTPLLHVPFVEGAQTWALQSKRDAALFDAEGWGLHRPAFETFLARLLLRLPVEEGTRRGTVAVLSGDVHYGFAGRIAYRAKTPFRAPGPVAVDAVIAQLTASAFKNEAIPTRGLHQFGYQWWGARAIEVLGFEQPLPRFRRAGWTNPNGERIDVGRIVEPPVTTSRESSTPWLVGGTPAVASWSDTSVERHGVPHRGVVGELVRAPEWEYDVSFVASDPPALPGPSTPATNGSHAAAARDHAALCELEGGLEIVGRANLGDVTVRWEDRAAPAVVHVLWWSRPKRPFEAEAPPPRPLTRYVIPAKARGAPPVLGLQVDVAGKLEPLADAWVYRREGTKTTVLRTDDAGSLLATADGTPSDGPWNYTRKVTAPTGAKVTLAFSRGARPVPPAVFTGRDTVFAEYTVPATGNDRTARITVKDSLIELTAPTELSLWPLLWELPHPDYAISGLTQQSMTPATGVREDDLAPAARVAELPRERGLRVTGRVAADVTAVRVQLFGANGPVPVRPGPDTSVAPVTELAATLAAAASGARTFEARIYLADAAAAFGPLQIVVLPEGAPVRRVDAFLVHLCGLQTALVADTGATQRGPVPTASEERVVLDFLLSPQAAGTPPTSAALTTQLRARRMTVYEIGIGRRPVRAGGIVVPRPQMPLWMGELQFVGVPEAQLRSLMRYRHHRKPRGAPGESVSLVLRAPWTLKLTWDGPDVNDASTIPDPPLNNPHIGFGRTRQREVSPGVRVPINEGRFEVSGELSADLRFGPLGDPIDAHGTLLTIGPDGALPGAMPPDPIDYPLPGRRPTVVAWGRRERWGRDAGTAPLDTLTFEFRPRVEVGGVERIRGGDGDLSVASVNLDGRRVDAGYVRTTAGPGVPAPAEPDLRLPGFRVRGRGPAGLQPPTGNEVLQHAPSPAALVAFATVAELEDLVGDLVLERILAVRAAAPAVAPPAASPLRPAWDIAERVNFLPDAVWQDTIARIVGHEADVPETFEVWQHFEPRRAGRRRYEVGYWGHEHGMPLFGAPHGYGLGQIDNVTFDVVPGDPSPRGATADEVWDFVDNLRCAVKLVLVALPADAWNALGPNLTNPAIALRRRQAVYRREIVRRYNGFREFFPQGNDWVIRPTHSATYYPRLPYPNGILGTGIVYLNGAGQRTWVAPIGTGSLPFPATEYGPGI